MGSAQITQIPVPTGTAVQAWTGVPNSSDQVLFWNQDINNVIYLGNLPQISAGGNNTIPVPPNSAFPLDASVNWFVIGSAQGITPLVIIPNAGAMFRGITQGLGNLAIPSIHSPNYVTGVSGWTINKDGSAEFNNLTIRGNFIGPDFFISNGDGTLTNDPGFFLYSATPAAGNLIFSISANGGHDKFNNNFISGSTAYNNTLLVATNTTGVGITYYTMSGNPGSTFTSTASAALIIGPPNILDITTDTWHTMSGFLNNWVATANTPRYMRSIDNRVILDGVMDATNATAATFLTMPAGYRPTGVNKLWAAGANGGVIAGQAPFVQVASTGSLAISGITLPTAGAHVTITGEYPLD